MEIVRMNMSAGFDRLRDEADDLAVAPHRIADLQRAQRNLVRRRNIGRDNQAVQFMQHRACGNRATRNCNVVLAMQRDDQ
jgi:hypothetical protein